MPTYTITKVHDGVRDWSSQKGGPMKSYRIDVEGPDVPRDKIELAQKADTAAPTVGQSIEGTIEKRQTPNGADDFKLNKAFGGGGGGGRKYTPRPDDSPLVFAMRQAQIVQQHSQSMAIEVLKLAGGDAARVDELMELLGVPMSAEVKGETVALNVVQAFTADVGRAGSRAWELESENTKIAKAVKEVASG